MIGTESSRATITTVPSDRHRTRTVREGGVGNGGGRGGAGGGGGGGGDQKEEDRT